MIPIEDKEKRSEVDEQQIENPETEENPAQECPDMTGNDMPGETEAAQTGASEQDETGEPGTTENGTEDSDQAAAPCEPAGKKSFRERREEKKAAKEAAKISKELEKKDEELALLNDKYLRICAEYDNFRKRSQKEKDALYGDVRANVITSFLPVYDNLVRAIETKTEDEAYAKGVEMIMNQFNTTLEKLGAEEIPALGEKFDPELHNAVMHTDDETKGENEIVEVFQKGFRIGDKIIRFAMVKVAN